MSRILISGAGMTGLSLAWQLTRHHDVPPEQIVIWEGASRVGGLIQSQRINDQAGAELDVDGGPESFALRSGTVATLLQEIGLEWQSPTAAPAWVYSQAGSHPLPAAGVFGIPTDLEAADLHHSLSPSGIDRARLDASIPVGPIDSLASLGQLVEARMGIEVVERLVAPVVRGVYGASVFELPITMLGPNLGERMYSAGGLAAALRDQRARVPAGAAVGGVLGGIHSITERLAAELVRSGVTIQTSRPVSGARFVDGCWSVRDATEGIPCEQLALTHAPDTWRELDLVPRMLDLARQWPDSQPVQLISVMLREDQLPQHPRAGILIDETGQSHSEIRADPDSAQEIVQQDGFPGALTYSSAKWSWIDESLPAGHSLIRLLYRDHRQYSRADLVEHLSRLWGDDVPESAVSATGVTWLRQPAQRAVAAMGPLLRDVDELEIRHRGLVLAGSWRDGSGIVASLASANAAAERIVRG